MSERVGELQQLADRLRAPDHRFTAEMFLIAREELRLAIRRLGRDLGGPGRNKPPLPVPAAVLRHRQRLQAARSA